MGHGVNDHYGQKYTTSQWIWLPFAKEEVVKGVSSGVRVEVPGAGLGANNSSSGVALELRTTTNSDDSLRVLVDSNIRGFYINPRWDSPLGLETSAAYTIREIGGGEDKSPPLQPTPDNIGAFGYWGADHDSFGYSRVVLFDIPRKDLVSLGQLQHANAGRFSYEPSYIAGNSYANPRIPLTDWKTTCPDTFSSSRPGIGETDGKITVYDASYLVNETLWDGYIFTTIPQNADNYDPDNNLNEPTVDVALFEKLLKREEHLANPRFIPYEPSGSTFNMATLQEVGDDDNQSAFHHNAGHLLVDGAFNVNSTSVDAWEAFLMGSYGMPYQKMDDTGKLVVGYEALEEKIRFPRVEAVFGQPFEPGSSNEDEGYWTGFRTLTPEEVRELAAEMVNQVIQRGPFLTLGDFINRKLETGPLGQKGALQAALDETVNKNPSSEYSSLATHPKLPAGENQAAGFSGQILQGDVLQALSPMMTVRSDTFTIRAYGESIDPNNGKVIEAWCEAVVQRYPDPVAPDPSIPFLEELAEPSSPYGREFKIISFRWLNKNEI